MAGTPPAPSSVVPTPAGTPAKVGNVPVLVHPTPANMTDTTITPSGKVVPGNYPTFDKSTPRVSETVVQAKPGSITAAGGRTAFITQAVDVKDADTVVVKDPSNPDKQPSLTCRVARIDADEVPHPAMYGHRATPGQPYGEKAATTLRDLILNKEVTVTVTQLKDVHGDDKGKIGRSVCEISINGDNISDKLIREGAAWVYRNYGSNKKASQEDLMSEALARSKHLGLWANPNPEYPSDYRKRMQREEQDANNHWYTF